MLKACWSFDIVSVDVIDNWHQNENVLKELHPEYFDQDDAETIRESSNEFMQWLDENIDED